MNSRLRWRSLTRAWTWPVSRSMPASKLTVPWRLYSWSRAKVASLPGSGGRSGGGRGDCLNAGRRMAALRQCARLLRLHVGPSRQEAVVHGPGIRPDQRMELRRGLALVAARLLAAPGAAGVDARSQSALSRNARALCARLRVARFPLDRRQRRNA